MQRSRIPVLALFALALSAPLPAAQSTRSELAGSFDQGPAPSKPPLPDPHVRVSAVAVDPNAPDEVWVCNRGNDSVSVVDTGTGTTVAEIDVGVWPRSLAFSADGTTVFVANQRGNVPVEAHFVSPPIGGFANRGSVSVIDVATRLVVQTVVDVGIEPYGVAVAPNGQYFAVSGFRSGTMKLYETAPPYGLLASFQYDRDLNHVPPGKTAADLDENFDFVADLDEPRAFAIRSDSRKLYVTHLLPGYVSVLRLDLDPSGVPTGVTLESKVSLDEYSPHPIMNPIPVQVVQSQGEPRFLDDIALSLTGRFAAVPHVLHNVNHDVNHDFGPGLAGDFANRVYPALSVVDTLTGSFARSDDDSRRVQFDPAAPAEPAIAEPFGRGVRTARGVLTLGAEGPPIPGQDLEMIVTGADAHHDLVVFYSSRPVEDPDPRPGALLVHADASVRVTGRSSAVRIPGDPELVGRSLWLQAAQLDRVTGRVRGLSNAVRARIGSGGIQADSFPFRAGHPGRVAFNREGDRLVLLNRGSEDVFLYDVKPGGELVFRSVFPPRLGFVERAALDTSTPMGDLPLGMALVDDPATINRDGLLYVVNETTRTLSTLRIDYDTGAISEESPQVSTLLGPDKMTLSQRVGQELFEDASRAQTSGDFNNSCGSCHFEGGADGNVWQRPNGPRSTMPVYGGSLLTGLILWKGVRLNMGETGPMFGGENGGTGVFDDAEQQGLVDYHAIIPTPLNPNLDPVTGDLTADAALGRDLFFGTNDTGMNPTLRHAGCATCHPIEDDLTLQTRGFTADFLDPILTSGENLETVDPSCFSLRDSSTSLNRRNINSAVNVDVDMDLVPDPDRNARDLRADEHRQGRRLRAGRPQQLSVPAGPRRSVQPVARVPPQVDRVRHPDQARGVLDGTVLPRPRRLVAAHAAGSPLAADGPGLRQRCLSGDEQVLQRVPRHPGRRDLRARRFEGADDAAHPREREHVRGRRRGPAGLHLLAVAPGQRRRALSTSSRKRTTPSITRPRASSAPSSGISRSGPVPRALSRAKR